MVECVLSSVFFRFETIPFSIVSVCHCPTLVSCPFTQVIVGTHILMANGGTIAHTGALNIALAARAHQVPYVVVTELYKLCPLYAFDQVCSCLCAFLL